MTRSATIIERAYELARGGKFRTIDDITKTLVAERYEGVAQHLAGTGLRKELSALMRTALARRADAAP